MNNKSLRNSMKLGILGLFIGILIFQSTLQTYVNNPLGETSFEDTLLDETANPVNQAGYNILKLPFLENTTLLSDWLENNMIDEATLPTSPSPDGSNFYPLYYAESDQFGNIIDDHHHLEDFGAFLGGLYQITGEQTTSIDNYIEQLDKYNFATSDDVGYYSWVNDGATVNSTEKDFMSNAQILLSILNVVLENPSVGTSAVKSVLTSQWNDLETLFLDTTLDVNDGGEMYNHSLSEPKKYMEDQLVAAIISYQMYKVFPSNGAYLARASNLMNELLSNGDGTDYFDDDSFDISRDVDPRSGENFNDNRNINTNAYGIWALAEHSYYNTGNTGYIDDAENIFQWNQNRLANTSTYSLFMTEAGKFGTSVENATIYLKNNAIMLTAVSKLFEITGNFTYYDYCMDMYDSIEQFFKDSSSNGIYFKSIEPENKSQDRVKNFGSNSYIVRSLSLMEDLANKATLDLTSNTSDTIIKGEEIDMNISSIYSFDKEAILFDETLENEVLISNSSFFCTIRNSSNDIVDSYSTSSNPDNDGTYEIIYNIESLNTGTYTISMCANNTGVKTVFSEISFEIISGIQLLSSEISVDEIIAGDVFDLNLTFDSSRLEDLNVSININSSSIVNQTHHNELIHNEASELETSLIYSIQALTEAALDSQIIVIEVYIDDDILISKTINLDLQTAISFQQTSDLTGYRGKEFQLEVIYKNSASESIDVKIVIDGEFIISDISSEMLNPGLSTKIYSILIEDDAPLRSIDYNIEVSRVSDDNTLISQDLSIVVENPLEFKYIEVPEFSYHFKKSFVLVSIYNHLDVNQNVTISIDDDINSSIVVLNPRENIFKVPIGSFLNPYNLNTEEFFFKITDMDGNLIYEQYISTKVKPSIQSLLLAYVAPILIPIIGMVVFKQIAMENKKRLS